MRNGLPVLVVVLGFSSFEATWAQQLDPSQSLCNPCVDSPVRPIPRENSTIGNSTRVITAEDMRELGVISVSDMINQLPGNVSSEEVRFNLGATILGFENEEPESSAEAAAEDVPAAEAEAAE